MNYSNGANGNGHATSNSLTSSFDGEAQVSLQDYLAIFYRSRWIIVAAFFVVTGLTAYITLTTPPTYEASATIIIDEKQGMGQSLFQLGALSQQQTLINNQVEILKSRALAQEVIQRLLASPHKDSLAIIAGLGVETTYYEVLKAWSKSVSIAPIRDTDLIEVKVTAPSPFEAAFLTNNFAEAYAELDRSLSRGEISQVVDFLNTQLQRKAKDLRASEEMLKDFLESEKIASLTDEAQQVVEQSAEFESLYKEALIDLEVAERRRDYLKQQLGRSKETLESEIAKVSSPLVLQLREEMAEIERNIAIFLSQGVGEADPQVQRERGKLNAIKGRLVGEIRKLIVEGLPVDDPLAQAQEMVEEILKAEVETSALQAKADALQRVVRSFAVKLESLPGKNVQLARLERSRKVDENLYMMMREKHEESRITQAGQIGKVRILDRAVPPVNPISPRRRLNLLLGIIIGLGLGVGVALLREHLDNSIRRIEDIERLGLTVLAAIPRLAQDELEETLGAISTHKRNGWTHTEAGRLVTHLRPKSPASEAYRTLRTNLQYTRSAQHLHSLLVTSAGPEEGKSTSISNLAIALGLQGTRTLLLDADLRRPVVHKTFSIDKDRGLTNVLIGKATLPEAIQSSGSRNLDILPSGILPPNPAELLGSSRMANLIKELQGKYDMLVFDSPPLLAVTDAAVLSRHVDGVLLVVKSGQTQHEALVRAIDLLRNVGAKVLGVLLNDVSRENAYGAYHYYYYYGEGSHKKKRKRRDETKTDAFNVK